MIAEPNLCEFCSLTRSTPPCTPPDMAQVTPASIIDCKGTSVLSMQVMKQRRAEIDEQNAHLPASETSPKRGNGEPLLAQFVLLLVLLNS